MMDSVEGSYTGKNAPRWPSTNSPLINSLYLRGAALEAAPFSCFDLALPATEPSCREYLCATNRCEGRFTAPIYLEKEYRESDKKKRATKHPHLVRKQRANLLRREKSQHDAKCGGDESAGTREKQRYLAVNPLLGIRIGGNL